jgi:antirestriction protein
MTSHEVTTGHVSQEQEPAVRPQIWVGSLSDYNAGVLYGSWLDAARDPDQVRADIASLLAESPTAAQEQLPAEEFGIFDYEGFWPARVDRYDPIDQVCQLATGIATRGAAYAAWVSTGQWPAEDQTSERFEQAYLGHFGSLHEYVDQFVEDMGYEQLLDQVVPAGIRPYVKVDTEIFARDLRQSGDVTVVEDAQQAAVWLFEANV